MNIANILTKREREFPAAEQAILLRQHAYALERDCRAKLRHGLAKFDVLVLFVAFLGLWGLAELSSFTTGRVDAEQRAHPVGVVVAVKSASLAKLNPITRYIETRNIVEVRFSFDTLYFDPKVQVTVGDTMYSQGNGCYLHTGRYMRWGGLWPLCEKTLNDSIRLGFLRKQDPLAINQ